MGRRRLDDAVFQASGARAALAIAADPARLAGATREQLGIAATFLARALAPFDIDLSASSLPEPGEARRISPRAAGALRQLEAAGQAIGVELRKRVSLPTLPGG